MNDRVSVAHGGAALARKALRDPLRFISAVRAARTFRLARGLKLDGRHDEASSALLRIPKALRDRPITVILTADCLPGRGSRAEASREHHRALPILRSDRGMARRDRAFPTAYIDARLVLVNRVLGEGRSEGWNGLARQLDRLSAERYPKASFVLPTVHRDVGTNDLPSARGDALGRGRRA